MKRLQRFSVQLALLLSLSTLAGAGLAQTAPQEASVSGKYATLLRKISVPEDKVKYGSVYDYGYWSNSTYADYEKLPTGYWVYVAPHWYIWQDLARTSGQGKRPG
jgi:hypothetical protein